MLSKSSREISFPVADYYTSTALQSTSESLLSMGNSFNVLLDSGCTRHVVRDWTLFRDYAEKSITIGTATCGSLDALGSGNVEFRYPFRDRHVIFTLRDCLYAPTAPINLLSVGTLVERGMSCLFSPGGITKVFYPDHHPKLPGLTFSATVANRLSYLLLNFIPPVVPSVPVTPVTPVAFPTVAVPPSQSAFLPSSSPSSHRKTNSPPKKNSKLPFSNPNHLVLDLSLPSHIVNDRSLFTTYTSSRKLHRTVFGNDIIIEGYGDVHIRTFAGKISILFRLRDCWHVPSSPHHFLSCKRVISQGKQVMLAGRTPRMIYSHKDRQAEPHLPKYVPFTQDGGNFVLKFQIPVEVTVSGTIQPTVAPFSLHASSFRPFAGMAVSMAALSLNPHNEPHSFPSSPLHHIPFPQPVPPSGSRLSASNHSATVDAGSGSHTHADVTPHTSTGVALLVHGGADALMDVQVEDGGVLPCPPVAEAMAPAAHMHADVMSDSGTDVVLHGDAHWHAALVDIDVHFPPNDDTMHGGGDAQLLIMPMEVDGIVNGNMGEQCQCADTYGGASDKTNSLNLSLDFFDLRLENDLIVRLSTSSSSRTSSLSRSFSSVLNISPTCHSSSYNGPYSLLPSPNNEFSFYSSSPFSTFTLFKSFFSAALVDSFSPIIVSSSIFYSSHPNSSSSLFNLELSKASAISLRVFACRSFSSLAVPIQARFLSSQSFSGFRLKPSNFVSYSSLFYFPSQSTPDGPKPPIATCASIQIPPLPPPFSRSNELPTLSSFCQKFYLIPLHLINNSESSRIFAISSYSGTSTYQLFSGIAAPIRPHSSSSQSLFPPRSCTGAAGTQDGGSSNLFVAYEEHRHPACVRDLNRHHLVLSSSQPISGSLHIPAYPSQLHSTLSSIHYFVLQCWDSTTVSWTHLQVRSSHNQVLHHLAITFSHPVPLRISNLHFRRLGIPFGVKRGILVKSKKGVLAQRKEWTGEAVLQGWS
jgi:hypothetical protein